MKQGVGRDRLVQLLEWMEDSQLVIGLLENYVETLNLLFYELEDEDKEVITTLIGYLLIDAYTYDWGIKESAANKWILTLCDQV